MNRRKQRRPCDPAPAAGLFIIALLLAAAVFTACGRPGETRSGEAPSAEADRPVPVDGVTSVYGKLVGFVEISGLIRGVNEASVVSETQGIVQEITFGLGDRVERGRVLVRVDDTIPRLTAEQAAVQLENARIELAAVTQRRESGSASVVELNRARIAVRGAEAAWQSAVKTAENTAIRAPIGGYIASRGTGVTVGNLITPGTRIAEITDLGRLSMTVSIGEREIGLFGIGASARVTIPACGEEAEARVTAIAAGSDPSTGGFPVVLQWDNSCPDRVRAGMSARGLIETTLEQQVLMVPAQALVTRGRETWLFTARYDGGSMSSSGKAQAVRREVVTGRTRGGRTEIVSGLEQGDIVVISGISGLSDGTGVLVSVTGSGADR